MPTSSSHFKHSLVLLSERLNKTKAPQRRPDDIRAYLHISSVRSNRNRLINQLYALHFAAVMHIAAILFIYMSFLSLSPPSCRLSVCVMLSAECSCHLNTWLCFVRAMCGLFRRLCNSNKYRCSFVLLVLRLDFFYSLSDCFHLCFMQMNTFYRAKCKHSGVKKMRARAIQSSPYALPVYK